MRFLLLVLLVGNAGWFADGLRAQSVPLLPSHPAVVTDAQGRCQLTYAPEVWQVQLAAGSRAATLRAGDTAAVVRLEARPLPDDRRDFNLLREGRPDSVLHRIQALPLVAILRLDQQAAGSFDKITYEYTYGGTTPGSRTHVLGQQRWRGGFAFRAEYRARACHDSAYLTAGRAVIASFAFSPNPWASRRYADQLCDGKMYGIAAQRFHNEQWEDDCRSINEFDPSDPSSPVNVHARVLPFQSYALAKGFDNCLYTVTKAPTDAPERVYRYDPATRQGEYTDFWLPAQGAQNVWISAATDDHGDLYFLTSDANRLVKVSPSDAHVTVVWTSDPLHKAPFYPYIGFASAGTHGNFCLDDANTMYMVYSTDGALFKIDLKNQQPFAEPVYLKGLPARGGYSDLLMQNDAQGRRRLYLAGPHALYQVDLARREASRVRKGTYTDLAGCNLFRVVRPPEPAPVPPATASWQGRVLDAGSLQPLPEARLRIDRDEKALALIISVKGEFAWTTTPGQAFRYHVELPGYFPADSTLAANPGPLLHDVLLRPLSVGTTLRLANVQFEQSKARMLPTSYAALDQLVRLLIDNPRLIIELRGHTDNVGPPEKNVALSEERVEAVKDYLTTHGVTAERIGGVGLGGAEPLASNEQEDTRRLNRRVEFRITAITQPPARVEAPLPPEP